MMKFIGLKCVDQKFYINNFYNYVIDYINKSVFFRKIVKLKK